MVPITIYIKKHAAINCGFQKDVIINGFLLAAFLVTVICMELDLFPVLERLKKTEARLG